MQVALERIVINACAEAGWTVVRANDADAGTGHGFISSQRMGLEVFKQIPVDAPLIVAEAVWQYSQHVLAGLRSHRGPILTVANFDGRWPGLVGLLNLNAGLTKMGREYASIWTVDGSDDWFKKGMREWLATGRLEHDASHVHDLVSLPATAEAELGRAVAEQLLADKAIIGTFDEGCMGMYNAILDDELLNPLGVYKERLSQSALWAEMQRVGDDEAEAVGDWLGEKGMTFKLGDNEASDLTTGQLRWQYKMYVAALRIADDFGLDAVGIQYQQGLKDLAPASDLVEGLLNNADRPPVTVETAGGFSGTARRCRTSTKWTRAPPLTRSSPIGSGWPCTSTRLRPCTTCAGERSGKGGSCGSSKFPALLRRRTSRTAMPTPSGGGKALMYFPAGGSTIKGVSKPGPIVWSRLYMADAGLHLDIGRGDAVWLPEEETQRRWRLTNEEWPIMHAVLHGVTRNQFMARHKANHVQVAYAPSADVADRALVAKASAFVRLGVEVHLCGNVDL